jgi:hypothetical protein
LRDAQLVGITKPAYALFALRCPYSGTAAHVPMMPKAGDWCASQSAGAADIGPIGLIFSNFNNLTHLSESTLKTQ